MRNWRIPLKVASGLLIVLGLLISLSAAASAVLDVGQTASHFDQVGDTGGSNQGFVPIIAPQAESVGQVAAPTLPPRAAGLNGKVQTPQGGEIPNTQPTSAVTTSPLLSGETPAADPRTCVVGRCGPPLTATPPPNWIPDRIVIPAIKLDAPVVPAKLKEVEYQGKQYQQWVAPPSFAAGWLTTSALLGVPGNTVLSGHHNFDGEVFGHLVDLKVGDLILMYSGETRFAYAVALIMILPERFEPLEVRLANTRWIQPSQDERLTLVTCWPYASNTHRLIIVATPVSLDDIQNYAVTPRLTPHPPLDWKSTPTLPPPG
jgi:LPXTG-site transpeptidase (sortase) family protein